MPYKPDDKEEAELLRRELGRRVRAGREAHGWSQEELAETIGVGAEMLSRYERGVKFPSHVTLVRLAKALGTTADALLGLDAGYYGEAPSGDLVRVVAKLSPTQQVAVASMIRELVSPSTRARKR
jgi:transcriptional regulator with XRE-family HTH domain